MENSERVSELDQIGFLLGRAYYSYIGLLQRKLDEHSLSGYLKPGMGSILFCLFRNDDRKASELAEELQIAKSTMTGLIAEMKRNELLTAIPDPNDLRSMRLRLTPIARSLEPKCHELATELEGLLARYLNEIELVAFRSNLKRIILSITECLKSYDDTEPKQPSPKSGRTDNESQ
jgi:DNA-binding MarR family transcriptional regulator